MRMTGLATVLLTASCCLSVAAKDALPLTTDERIAACISAEDTDPSRAIALADDILANPASLTVSQRAEALGCRGWSRIASGQRDEAFRDAHALYTAIQQQPVDAERVRLTRRAGGILHRGGDRVGAVDYYARAVAEAESLGLEAERIPLLVNLGVLYSEFEEHERARVNYEQALALMRRLGDFRYEAAVRFNLGLNYAGQRRYDEALPQLERALELLGGDGTAATPQSLAVKIALANANLYAGDTERSKWLIDDIQSSGAEIVDESMKLQLVVLEAEQLAATGDARTALALIDGLLPSSAMSDIQRWSVLKVRTRLLEDLGRFKEAAATLRDINTLRETLLRHQNHERLAALDAHMRDREQRFELERLQAEALVQSEQLKTSRRMQWAGVIIAGLIALVGLLVTLGQRRMNQRLLEASHTDPLTTLSNRRHMALHLQELSTDARRHTALLLFDIDHFKQINDEHGHDVGDQVLVEYARRLREYAGRTAHVARWGGEEFLAAVPATDVRSAQAIAESLQDKLATPILTRKGLIPACVSIGIANLPLSGIRSPTAWHQSLQLADNALYLAKRLGRSAWVSYWIEQPIADWPPERLGKETQLARSLGVIQPEASRHLREPLVAVAG